MPLPIDIALCLVLQAGVSTNIPACLEQSTWQRTDVVVVCETRKDVHNFIELNIFGAELEYDCDWKRQHEVILGQFVNLTSNGSTQSAMIYEAFVGPEEWSVEGPLNVETVMQSYRKVYVVDVVDFVAL